jgi:hypothetical protein
MSSISTADALSEMDDQVVWSDARQHLARRYGLIMGDRVTMGTPRALQTFNSIWDNRHLARPGMAGMEGCLIAHRSLSFHTLTEGMVVRRLPVEFSNMCDPLPPPISELRAAIMQDAGPRMDEADRAFLAAVDLCEP